MTAPKLGVHNPTPMSHIDPTAPPNKADGKLKEFLELLLQIPVDQREAALDELKTISEKYVEK